MLLRVQAKELKAVLSKGDAMCSEKYSQVHVWCLLLFRNAPGMGGESGLFFAEASVRFRSGEGLHNWTGICGQAHAEVRLRTEANTYHYNVVTKASKRTVWHRRNMLLQDCICGLMLCDRLLMLKLLDQGILLTLSFPCIAPI